MFDFLKSLFGIGQVEIPAIKPAPEPEAVFDPDAPCIINCPACAAAYDLKNCGAGSASVILSCKCLAVLSIKPDTKKGWCAPQVTVRA